MNAGTIFVLCLGAAFVSFVVYMAILSRRAHHDESSANQRDQKKKRA
jgi:hypothetical protein